MENKEKITVHLTMKAMVSNSKDQVFKLEQIEILQNPTKPRLRLATYDLINSIIKSMETVGKFDGKPGNKGD